MRSLSLAALVSLLALYSSYLNWCLVSQRQELNRGQLLEAGAQQCPPGHGRGLIEAAGSSSSASLALTNRAQQGAAQGEATADVEEVAEFSRRAGLVIFLGGGQLELGSFALRGRQLAVGLQMYTGLSARAMLEPEFIKESFNSTKVAAIIIVKFIPARAALFKARQLTPVVIYDPIDNFWSVPGNAAGVLVGTWAQKRYMQHLGITAPTLVLPHHNSNFNGLRASAGRGWGPGGNLTVTAWPEVPKEVLEAVQAALKNVTGAQLQLVAREKPFKRDGFLWSLECSQDMLNTDIALRWWRTSLSSGQCLKPGQRLINTFGMGIPTVTFAGLEGFQEDVASVLGTGAYRYFARTAEEAAAHVLRLAMEKEELQAAAAQADMVAEAYSLKAISWKLHAFLRHLHDMPGVPYAAAEQGGDVVLPECQPEQLGAAYERENKTMRVWQLPMA